MRNFLLFIGIIMVVFGIKFVYDARPILKSELLSLKENTANQLYTAGISGILSGFFGQKEFLKLVL